MKVYESRKVKSLVNEVFDEAETFGWYKAMAHLQRRMTDIPELDMEEHKHGYWQKKGIHEDSDGFLWKCSCCGSPFWFRLKYCGECGAKMDMEEGRND